MKAFLDELCQNEGGGTVFVGAFDNGEGEKVVAVCTHDERPTYWSALPGELSPQVAAALDALRDNCFSVITDPGEWRQQLQEWYEMGGGDGQAW